MDSKNGASTMERDPPRREKRSEIPSLEAIRDFVRRPVLGREPGRFRYRNEPLSVFGYRTAEQLVLEGRTEDVLRYVVSLEAAAAAHGGPTAPAFRPSTWPWRPKSPSRNTGSFPRGFRPAPWSAIG